MATTTRTTTTTTTTMVGPYSATTSTHFVNMSSNGKEAIDNISSWKGSQPFRGRVNTKWTRYIVDNFKAGHPTGTKLEKEIFGSGPYWHEKSGETPVVVAEFKEGSSVVALRTDARDTIMVGLRVHPNRKEATLVEPIKFAKGQLSQLLRLGLEQKEQDSFLQDCFGNVGNPDWTETSWFELEPGTSGVFISKEGTHIFVDDRDDSNFLHVSCSHKVGVEVKDETLSLIVQIYKGSHNDPKNGKISIQATGEQGPLNFIESDVIKQIGVKFGSEEKEDICSSSTQGSLSNERSISSNMSCQDHKRTKEFKTMEEIDREMPLDGVDWDEKAKTFGIFGENSDNTENTNGGEITVDGLPRLQ